MSMTRRRLLHLSKGASHIYLGDTPVLHGNTTVDNFATITQAAGVIFNYILVISKDRNAYKQIAYTQDQLTYQSNGVAVIKQVPNYSGYQSNSTTFMFKIMERENNSQLTIGFNRGTGGIGNFMTYYPQAYDVYALIEPYEEGDIT